MPKGDRVQPKRPPGARGRGVWPWLLPVALALYNVLVWGALAAPTRAAANGAGVVVRHGDGRVVYAYVPFDEARISGLELLRRAGLDVVSGNAGFGEGVCAIDGEGCPADNCFCKSYGSPSVYWRYYTLKDGRWIYSSLGASVRLLGDGDVDGWEWSGGAPHLPAVTIGEIAARAGAAAAASPIAAPTPTPPNPTATRPAPTTSAASVASGPATVSPSPPPFRATAVANLAPSEPTARAVGVAPGGETTAVGGRAAEPAAIPWLGYAAVLGLVAALAGYLLFARRRRHAEGEADGPDAR
jgi:hypothetical protein